MIKIIKHQTSFILRQNITLVVFFILLSIVFLNFGSNVLAFQGRDVIEMYHPAKLLALSYDQVYNNMDIMLLLIQLYPILIVCPAGFTLLSEKNRLFAYCSNRRHSILFGQNNCRFFCNYDCFYGTFSY